MSTIDCMVVHVDGLTHLFRTCQYLSFNQIEIAAHSCGQWGVSQVDHLGRLVVIQFLGH